MQKQNNQQNQGQHWLDKLAKGILSWQEKKHIAKLHVDDMKTPSGRVHTGALRGVMLHDLVAKAVVEELERQGRSEEAAAVVSTYVFNDMDPMDGLPAYLDEKIYAEHMGKPLAQIPRPELDACGIDLSKMSESERQDFEKAKNFAELYAIDFIHALRKLGCDQEIIWSHQLYEAGKMDEVIGVALDNVEKFRQIYKEVADYDLPDNWYPFQVICPVCGKVGTTLVTDWDGQEVTFECQEDKVDWAKGCGHQGKISPFGGNGKLLWKADWPAHWRTLGVTVEGAGKDHTSAGGSRDMANAESRQIFEIEPPFDIPYEWILIRGAKMSSSKGVGTSAREFTELFPATVGRFLFINKHYGQVIDFDPQTMAIPDLFDDYDNAARIYWGQEEGDQRLGRAFSFAQIAETPKPLFLARFRDLALWVQYPEKDVYQEAAKAKGSELTDLERQVIDERLKYVEIWLDKYAPEEFQWRAKAEMPIQASELTAEQRDFLQALEGLVESQAWQPADLQQAIFELSKENIGPRAAFGAIYLAFLGKKSGPRAAWFLLSIDEDLRKTRIEELKNV